MGREGRGVQLSKGHHFPLPHRAGLCHNQDEMKIALSLFGGRRRECSKEVDHFPLKVDLRNWSGNVQFGKHKERQTHVEEDALALSLL